MIRTLSLAALIACLCSLSPAGPARAQNKEQPKLAISREAQAIIDLTNKARAREKLKPLKPNALLFQCAQKHSEHMARLMKAGHVIDGKTAPPDRVLAVGYDYKTCGENVAQMPPRLNTIPRLFEGWMNSPDHRREILRGEYEEIGIGIAKDARGFFYYTQVFGTHLRPDEIPAK